MKKLAYDLHIHSCLSPCGDKDMTPNNIAGMAMLNGLRVAALTDHNTSKNCPAFFSACERCGIIPIAGMELTTVEEIHMVCLFPTLEGAMDFDCYVDKHRLRVANRPDIFGEQLILDGNDEIIGHEADLLILATDLGLTAAAQLVRQLGGIAFPAHIDRQSNGMIAILGAFPEEPGFTSAELHDAINIPEYTRLYPALSDMLIVNDSDAHRLEDMNPEPPLFAGLEDDGDDDTLRRRIIMSLRKETP